MSCGKFDYHQIFKQQLLNEKRDNAKEKCQQHKIQGDRATKNYVATSSRFAWNCSNPIPCESAHHHATLMPLVVHLRLLWSAAACQRNDNVFECTRIYSASSEHCKRALEMTMTKGGNQRRSQVENKNRMEIIFFIKNN